MYFTLDLELFVQVAHIDRFRMDIWQRFCTEYVPSLHPRSKGLKAQRDFKVGDVVTLFEEQGMKK